MGSIYWDLAKTALASCLVAPVYSGGSRDPQNIFGSCESNRLQDPWHTTLNELIVDIVVGQRKIKEILSKVPKIRYQHLQLLVEQAKQRGDFRKASNIMKMLVWKAS